MVEFVLKKLTLQEVDEESKNLLTINTHDRI